MKKYYFYSAQSDEVYEFNKRLELKNYLRGIRVDLGDFVREGEQEWEEPRSWLRKTSVNKKMKSNARSRSSIKGQRSRVQGVRKTGPSKKVYKLPVVLSLFMIISVGVYFMIPKNIPNFFIPFCLKL